MADTVTTPATDIAADKPAGIRDQITGLSHKAIDAVAGATGKSDDPRVAQVKDFAAKKPLAIAAAAGVIGLALLNTLRGRR